MANRPARCTKADLNRAIDVVLGKGLPLAAVEVTLDGFRVLIGNEPKPAVSTLEERCEASAQTRRMARRRG
jgi:hypothetical protein